ncbi:MAG: hypothetical protein LLG01_18640 [Planctomycetaceae bacterium]|nr:hypothetical protein [Planctomycetaceae bacterium]
MLPSVDFCGLNVTRLVLGANPFGGYSHQTPQRDQAMVNYYTPEKIIETWHRAEAAGINTMVTNNETPHVTEAVKRYLGSGGKLQWIAQVGTPSLEAMPGCVDAAIAIGAKAFYFHGMWMDNLFAAHDEKTLRAWVAHARRHRVPVGAAAHNPLTHYWMDSLDLLDFHVVCFFNCGSVHARSGHRFRLTDAIAATECIRRLRKPCVGYKIMAAGRIDAAMAFEYAFDNIKSTDVVNVGMFRGDKDDMVEENAAIVQRLLS